MKAFIFNGEVYIRAIPGKRLFQSTMVHDVVNRGSIFALRCSDQQLTIIDGNAEVEHIELNIPQLQKKVAPPAVLDKLAAIKLSLERPKKASQILNELYAASGSMKISNNADLYRAALHIATCRAQVLENDDVK